MGARRKRSKSSRSIDSAVAASSLSGGFDSLDDVRFPVEPSTFECGSFASRCSVRVINEVVSKFDLVKRELVKSTGFESILQFPMFKQFNRKFALWLMSCVNEKTCTISILEHISIRFNKADVSHVFGIPACGKTILDVRLSSREAKEKVLNELLPSDFKEIRSVKLVQEVVEREYEYPMSKLELDRFRVAFVVFVASNLFAPSAKYDYACVDYWNGIQDPDCIGSYDWSEYVIARSIEGVTKLKQDISSNIKFPNITGCSIFLQVLYLDSLYLEGLSKPHTTFPRIIDFPHDQFRLMIQADRNFARYENKQTGLPVGDLREPSKCVYSWAYDHLFLEEVSADGCLFAVWEATIAMVNLLKIPLEASGPIFFAVADFQEQINSGLVLSGIQSIKIMSVLVSIMLPYSRGFSYQSSYPVDSTSTGRCLVEAGVRNGTRRLSSLLIRIRRERLVNNRCLRDSARKNQQNGNPSVGSSTCCCASAACKYSMRSEHVGTRSPGQPPGQPLIASLDEIPHKLNINLRVATAMSQFYAAIRNIKPVRDFDLNAISSEDSSSREVRPTLVIDVPRDLASPWDLGYGWCLDGIDISAVLATLNTIKFDESFVIVHNYPKYIQVSLRALCDQILGKCEFELDLMDALTRNLIQEDDELYRGFGGARWRIFFESDFMEAIVTGSFDLVDANLGQNLRLSNTHFDLERTKLVFFPLLLQCSWVCFTWNLEDNVLYVFEPSFVKPIPEFRAEAIERSAYLLKIALQTLSSLVLNGVDLDPTGADVRFVTLPNALVDRCSMFTVLRCFDGHRLIPNAQGVDVDAVAAMLLRRLVSLKNNTGAFPRQLIGEL